MSIDAVVCINCACSVIVLVSSKLYTNMTYRLLLVTEDSGPICCPRFESCIVSQLRQQLSYFPWTLAAKI